MTMLSALNRPTDSATLAFQACNILVLGDIMLDRYVTGAVERVSPEGPYLVLRASGAHTVLGGAGNVANNLAALGAHATLIGAIGDDPAADTVTAAALNLPQNLTLRAIPLRNRPTTIKTRLMSGGHHLIRLDEENATPLNPQEAAALLEAYTGALPNAEIVILSDYAKGVLSDAILPHAIALANAAGKPVIADPKRETFTAYSNASVITPNAAEIRQATGIAVTDDASAEQACHAALQSSGAGAILLTRSEKGLTLLERGRPALHLPTEARAVADVSGAGDTLVAVFAAMLARGAAMPEAAQIANLAAGLVVAKPGTATISAAELAAAMHRQELLALDEKILTPETARRQIETWRRAHLRVGFTNGCFDLIHPGHVRLLNRARARCDRLVVALNTDASVKRLKGPTRPVQNELARATVMASIAAVDLVVLFDEDTPLDLITALRPDILFKGADYREDQVVGADVVKAYGGEVALIDLESGHSTTGIIRRMALPEGKTVNHTAATLVEPHYG